MVKISNPKSSVVANVKYCDTFSSKLFGLMFTKNLAEDSGVLFVANGESKISTSVHMFFMNYNLTVLWLDKNKVIVDKVLAKKWFPFYIPKKPAKYVLELYPSRFSSYEIGDELFFSLQD